MASATDRRRRVALLQFSVSNYVNYQLTDIIAALGSAAAVVLLVRVWSPRAPGAPASVAGRRPAIAGGSVTDAALERKKLAESGAPLPKREVWLAFAPYLIIVIVLGIVSVSSVNADLEKATNAFSWPGLHVLNAKGETPKSEIFKLNWLTAAGTWLLISGVLTMIVLRVRPALAARSTCGHSTR